MTSVKIAVYPDARDKDVGTLTLDADLALDGVTVNRGGYRLAGGDLHRDLFPSWQDM